MFRRILQVGIFLISCVLSSSQAAYYDTLPAGVFNFTYRYIQTSDINGSYSSTGDLKGYNVKANINADAIKGLNTAVDAYLNSLSPADYAAFSFGTFEGRATSKVTAQVFGGGVGLTNWMTLYAYVPYYKARVDLQVERTEKGRSNVGGAIQLENLPDVDLRLIQSLFVNYYHYQPLGRWESTDIGDTEVGFMTQLMKTNGVGLLINPGVVIPTGKEDNPDILQDISFGDGQWDAFFELGGGADLNSAVSIDQWNRVTYQFPYKTRVRLPESLTFPLTMRSGEAKVKLGNKFQSNFQTNFQLLELWKFSLLYTFEYTEKSDYQSEFAESDQILEADTEKHSHTARANLNFSTVPLYQSGRFFLPLEFNIAGQTILGGKNTPKYERYEFETRFYF